MSRPLRYTFILVLVALGTVLAALGGWRYARASAPVPGPIILISIDSLRADHLAAYGYRGVPTPTIDGLARDGVVFEHAYSHAPETLPAHAALLSGRLPFETGVRDNVGFAVRPAERLLPQMLGDRGYATAGVVSSYILRKETGIGRGFGFFDGDMPAGGPGGPIVPVQRDGTLSETVAEHWLEHAGSTRVFLFLQLNEPHKPYTPPPRFAGYPPYDGEIAYSDEIVGLLVRYLKAHQLYDQSTIVLLSDHGEGLGEHGERGHGLFLYDETIHVPLIIKQAGGAGAGRRVTDVVQHLDIVPTILDLVKAPIPGNLRGRSLTSVLDGTGRLPAQPVYSEALRARYQFGWSELQSLTGAHYRYIKAPREELYDLQRDPDEQENIAADRGDTRQALRGTLDKLAAGTTIPAPAAIAAETREYLQALGYIGGETDTADGPGDRRADPKDKREIFERYRAAVDLAGERKWREAIAELQGVLRQEPEIADLWAQLATFAIRAERYEQAIDAYRHSIDLRPSDSSAYLGAANALLKVRRLEEARAQAAAGAEAAGHDPVMQANAHQVLAAIALARHDPEGARHEAALGEESNPQLPLAAYVDARLFYDQGRYADALPLFEQASEELRKSRGLAIPEMHYYMADTLVRLEQYEAAEAQFAEELRAFPYNLRARGGLATLYQATGRSDAAMEAVAEMTRVAPTPESYALAARLLTTFGDRRQAEAIRAEARRAFADRTP